MPLAVGKVRSSVSVYFSSIQELMIRTNYRGLACIYREKGQPGLRPGYGKAIEQRLSVLESNFQTISQRLENVLHHIRPGSFNQPDVTHSLLPAAEITDVPNMWQPMQQGMDMGKFATTCPSMQLGPLTPSVNVSLPCESDSDGLPSSNTLRELVDLFFELVYPRVPMFHRTTLTANMFAPERQILLHGILVVACRFWKKPEPSSKNWESYMTRSRDKILTQAIHTHSIISTQALTLLALDALGQGPGPRACNIMAMLVTAAQQLRLNRSHLPCIGKGTTALVRNEDSDDEFDASIIEVEERHRLFWAIYSLDRFSSMTHGQPGSLNQNEIHLPYPASDEDWTQGEVPEWFNTTPRSTHTACSARLKHCHIDVLALLDRSNKLLTSPVDLSLPAGCQEWQNSFRQLDTTVNTWFESLPQDVRGPPSRFNSTWMMLHSTFHL